MTTEYEDSSDDDEAEVIDIAKVGHCYLIYELHYTANCEKTYLRENFVYIMWHLRTILMQ